MQYTAAKRKVERGEEPLCLEKHYAVKGLQRLAHEISALYVNPHIDNFKEAGRRRRSRVMAGVMG
jgi:hypothetical protein